MESQIHLGNKYYSIKDFKDKLKIASPTDVKAGPRKINIGGDQFRYNEILNAVQNTIHKQKKTQDAFISNDDLHEIYSRLQTLKNEGHGSTGIIYNLFRRTLPNFFREQKLNEIHKELDVDFPSTAQLKERVTKPKDTNVTKKDKPKELKTYEAVLKANELINEPTTTSQDWYKFWTSLPPNMAGNVFKAIPEENWPNALSGFLPKPLKETTNADKTLSVRTNEAIPLATLGSLFTGKRGYQTLHSVYEGMTVLQREQYFPGLQMELGRNGRVLINGQDLDETRVVVEKRHNLLVEELKNAGSAEKVAEVIFHNTNYIWTTVLGYNEKNFSLEKAKQQGRFLDAKKEVEFVIDQVKTHEDYKEYVTEYLQNVSETPVIQLGQAAILMDYLSRKQDPPATKQEWAHLWMHFRPEAIGAGFIMVAEEAWPDILDSFLLPQIKKLAGINSESPPEISTPGFKRDRVHPRDGDFTSASESEEELIALTRSKKGPQLDLFFKKIVNPITNKEEPVTPYLHKLHSIYAVMTNEQRKKHFGELQLKDNDGAIQLSKDGKNWATFY